MNNNQNEPYSGLVLSSGGFRGIQILGALTYLNIWGYLDGIKRYAGCSVGSVISVLMAVGYTPIELFRAAIDIKIFNGFQDIDVEGFKNNFGLLNNQNLREELEKLILVKRKSLPTLLELYNEGIYIAFAVCDRRTKKGYKIDYLSNPTLLASEATLMSSNVPGVFPPIEFEGMKIVDGALTNPFPIEFLDNKTDKILGICVYGKPDGDDTKLLSFVTNTLMIGVEEIQRMICKNASDKVDILEMFVKDFNLLDSSVAWKPKLKMFFKGVKYGKIMVAALSKRKRRRNTIEKKSFETKVSPTNFPDALIMKCLVSQPLDILCQAALSSHQIIEGKEINVIEKHIKNLSLEKIERLTALAKTILREPRSKNVNPDIVDREYEINEKVKIKENYSQKLYDQLPLQFRAVAKVFVDSMGEDKANSTIHGLNIIFEGLNRLGFNVFDGPLLSEPKPYFQEKNADRVEMVDEEDIQNELNELQRKIQRETSKFTKTKSDDVD